jgi:hypothetical protein
LDLLKCQIRSSGSSSSARSQTAVVVIMGVNTRWAGGASPHGSIMAPNRVESKPFQGWKQFEKKGGLHGSCLHGANDVFHAGATPCPQREPWLQRLGAGTHQLARPVASPTQAAALTVTDGVTPMPHDQSNRFLSM